MSSLVQMSKGAWDAGIAVAAACVVSGAFLGGREVSAYKGVDPWSWQLGEGLSLVPLIASVAYGAMKLCGVRGADHSVSVSRWGHIASVVGCGGFLTANAIRGLNTFAELFPSEVTETAYEVKQALAWAPLIGSLGYAAVKVGQAGAREIVGGAKQVVSFAGVLGVVGAYLAGGYAVMLHAVGTFANAAAIPFKLSRGLQDGEGPVWHNALYVASAVLGLANYALVQRFVGPEAYGEKLIGSLAAGGGAIYSMFPSVMNEMFGRNDLLYWACSAMAVTPIAACLCSNVRKLWGRVHKEEVCGTWKINDKQISLCKIGELLFLKMRKGDEVLRDRKIGKIPGKTLEQSIQVYLSCQIILEEKDTFSLCGSSLVEKECSEGRLSLLRGKTKMVWQLFLKERQQTLQSKFRGGIGGVEMDGGDCKNFLDMFSQVDSREEQSEFWKKVELVGAAIRVGEGLFPSELLWTKWGHWMNHIAFRDDPQKHYNAEETLRIFIRPSFHPEHIIRSRMDPRVHLSDFFWAVTLVSTQTETHAALFFEAMEGGKYVSHLADFFGISKGVAILRVNRLVDYKKRSRTIVRSRKKILKLMWEIHAMVGKKILFSQLGQSSVFNGHIAPFKWIAELKSLGGERNCCDWALEQLAKIQVVIMPSLGPWVFGYPLGGVKELIYKDVRKYTFTEIEKNKRDTEDDVLARKREFYQHNPTFHEPQMPKYHKYGRIG